MFTNIYITIPFNLKTKLLCICFNDRFALQLGIAERLNNCCEFGSPVFRRAFLLNNKFVTNAKPVFTGMMLGYSCYIKKNEFDNEVGSWAGRIHRTAIVLRLISNQVLIS